MRSAIAIVTCGPIFIKGVRWRCPERRIKLQDRCLENLCRDMSKQCFGQFTLILNGVLKHCPSFNMCQPLTHFQDASWMWFVDLRDILILPKSKKTSKISRMMFPKVYHAHCWATQQVGKNVQTWLLPAGRCRTSILTLSRWIGMLRMPFAARGEPSCRCWKSVVFC